MYYDGSSLTRKVQLQHCTGQSMDGDAIQRLRQRYAGRDAFDSDDPILRRAAEELRRENGGRALPYSGVPTLLALRYAQSLDDLDVAAIGVPSDLGVSNRAGARFGPRAVRTIERVGPYHPTFRNVPKLALRAADIGDVPLTSRFSLEQTIQDIEKFYREIATRDIRPLSVGGDHSITYPILRALGTTEPVGLVHIDAHCDTMGAFEGSKFNHGGPFRLATLDGVLNPQRTIQIGIRGSSNVFWEFSHASGMTVIYMEDVLRMGLEAVIAKARRVVGDAPTYISVDMDAFDPAFAPGTGTPEVGGLESREGLALLRGLAGLNVIGADVVEVAPQYDTTTNTAQLAAQLLFEELALLSLAPPKR